MRPTELVVKVNITKESKNSGPHTTKKSKNARKKGHKSLKIIGNKLQIHKKFETDDSSDKKLESSQLDNCEVDESNKDNHRQLDFLTHVRRLITF